MYEMNNLHKITNIFIASAEQQKELKKTPLAVCARWLDVFSQRKNISLICAFRFNFPRTSRSQVSAEIKSLLKIRDYMKQNCLNSPKLFLWQKNLARENLKSFCVHKVRRDDFSDWAEICNT